MILDIAFVCFLLRCLVLYESKVGVMREDDGWVGVVGECKKGGCDGGHVEREVVGDCWGWSVWKGRMRVEGWHWMRKAIANNQKWTSSCEQIISTPPPSTAQTNPHVHVSTVVWISTVLEFMWLEGDGDMMGKEESCWGTPNAWCHLWAST